ncbi:hypothetical protein F5Y18DRAFT_195048 [Xylariaceae sp. FL1019]|nr:hypothetical protein F5Y18DRAFT_195048 [Xylariaceae sp. FL1019]
MAFKDVEYTHTSSYTKYPTRWRDTRQAPFSRLRPVRKSIIIAFILGLFYLTHLHITYRRALLSKYSPTIFPPTSSWDISNIPWNPSNSSLAGPILEHRKEWKRVGGGFEGDVFVFGEHVIKTFHISRSPLRNCVEGVRIPTEILAMYGLGGIGGAIREETDFLPMKDFFLEEGENEREKRWYIVMPYLPSGNLENLAKRLRGENLSHRELDSKFRASWNRMLSALGRMHEDGLCHDDVKMDNIFVADSHAGENGSHWILADFGNVREIGHPYHKSRIWREAGQIGDCRVNDVVRLVKGYVSFLRMASSGDGAEAFDEAFWEGRESWSRLYWAAVRDAVYEEGVVERLREKSEALPPLDGYEGFVKELREPWRFGGRFGSSGLERRTEMELHRGIPLPEGKAKILGLASMFGKPTVKCR